MALKFIRRMKSFNRRQAVRLNVNCIAKFDVEEDGRKTSCLTNIMNISEGGILLITFDKKMKQNSLVELQFQLPTAKKPISALGQVRSTTAVRKNLFRSGVKFLSVKEEDKKIIKDFVDLRAKGRKK